MTTLYTASFTGSNGSAPADFVTSEVVGTGGTRDIQSNTLRLLTTATNFNTQRLILPSGNWSKADGEAAITATTQTGVGQLLLQLRASGTWDATEGDLATTCYAALINMPGNAIAFYKNVAGTVTQIGTDQAFTFADATTYGIKFKVAGTALSLKVWTGSEPGPYTYTQTDSSVSAAGQFQMTFRTVDTAVRDVRLDNLTLDDLAATITTVSPTLNINGVFAYATDPTALAGELVFDFVGGSVGLAIGAAGVTGTVARTLADTTVAATGALGITGTVVRTLAATTSTIVTGASGAAGTAARTLANTASTAAGTAAGIPPAITPSITGGSTFAYATDPLTTAGDLTFDFVTGQVGLTLAYGASAAATSGTVAVTLAALQVAGPLLDEAGVPILNESGVAILLQGAIGFHGISGTVAKSLANITSTTAGSTVGGSVARTLQNATAAASGGSSNGGTLARTLQSVVLQATGALGVSGTVAKTLANVTSAASGAFGGGAGTFGTVAVTLDSVEANSALTDEFGDPILDHTGLPILDEAGDPILDEAGQPVLDESGLPILVRGAEGAHAIGGIVARTLANVVSTASGIATATTTGTVARTLANVTSVASGGAGTGGTLAQPLANLTSTSVTGTVGVTGTGSATLGNITSAASGTSTPGQVAGNLGLTLANVTLAASGSSIAGSVAETLDDATMAATGTAGAMPVTGTLAVTLAPVTSQAAGYPTVIGEVARTLDGIVGGAVGSSVAGSLAETLDDVTAAGYATITITVYGIGKIEAIYRTGHIEAIYDAGRIFAVARSRS